MITKIRVRQGPGETGGALMPCRISLIFVFLLTMVFLPYGFDGDLCAQTNSPNNQPPSNSGDTKTGPITNRNSRAYKRMQMMIEQAEWARIRAEKIRADTEKNAETPK
jgi:hypothetical protein